jgi:hypothetical protein
MLKISFYELKNNIWINILICIQLIIVFVLAIATSSIIAYHYTYYNNFKDYFESDGYLYNMDYFYLNDNNLIATDSQDIENELSHADVIASYEPMVNYYDSNGRKLDLASIAYDREIIKRHTPEISEGTWLKPDSEDDDCIGAVISQNNYNIKVGDIIFMNNIFYEYPEKLLKIKIIGVLEDNARIIGYTKNTYRNTRDYSDIYCDYSLDNEDIPMLIMNEESIKYCHEKYDVEAFVKGWVFVKFSDDITEDQIIQNETILGNYAQIATKEDLAEVAVKSQDNLREKLIAILPIFIGAFILTIISSLCSGAVSVKKQMKNYAIYSICGMPWHQSTGISVIATYILTAISFIISIGCIFIITSINKETTINFGIVQFGVCIGVALIYSIISALLPSLIINGTSIKEILRNNE